MTKKYLFLLKLFIIVLMFVVWVFGNTNTIPEGFSTFSTDELINRKGVLKIFNDFDISKDMVVNGNLKIIGGNLTVSGTVNGEIHVLGGNINIYNTAVINGTIITLGGTIYKDTNAIIKGEVLEVNQNKVSFSRKKTKRKSGWKNIWPDDSQLGVLEDNESRSDAYLDDVWVRYNRSEGLYLQLNMHILNEFIPGNVLYGGVGRSFSRNKYSGIIGIEQRYFQNNFQIYLERYDNSHTDDTWRITDKLNSLAAFLIHEDFLDWYHTDGFQGGININLPLSINANVIYTDETQERMNTVASWSLFGSNKEFKGMYPIHEGDDVNYRWELSIGQSYKWNYDSSFTSFLLYSQAQSTESSDFNFDKKEIVIDTFLPFARNVGIHLLFKSGSLSGNNYGTQHMFHIGGIGSLRGYDWKQFSESQYSSGTIELVFDELSIFYDRAASWESDQNFINANHWNKLLNSHSGASFGMSVGNKKARLDIIKPLRTEDNEIRLNFILNDIDF